ncbi:hypothetical protein ACNQFZ_11735 [Schinkia sp. CFF1]
MSDHLSWEITITEIFSEGNKFLAATELISILCEKINITRDYARQLIRRAVKKNLIKSSHPFKFRNGQYVYMANDNQLNLETLIQLSKVYKPSMYRVLSLLKKEGNLLSFYEARKAAATPIENIDRYKLTKLDEEIKELITQDFIFAIKDEERDISYIAIKDLQDSPQIKGLMKRHYEKMRLDSIFIPDILRWLREHNFINSESPLYRRVDNPSIGAKHNDFLWDVCTYTNTTGFSINVGGKDKQTLVILDILIHREYLKEDLDGFYNRIQSVRNSTQSEVRKVLPIIFYVDIDENVINEIKRLNLLHFSLQSIFGKRVTELIQSLDYIQMSFAKPVHSENDSNDIVENVEKSLKLMDETGHLDNMQNLKGDLFESLMYVVISNLFPHNSRIEHSKIIKPYEYDVIVQRDEEIIIFELKGFKNTTIINLGDNKTKNTVKWFFGKTLPHAKVKCSIPLAPFGYDKSKIKACYITSGNFSKEAELWLEKTNESKLKPNSVDCYYDRKKLLSLIKSHENLGSMRNSTGFVNILEKYYLKELT